MILCIAGKELTPVPVNNGWINDNGYKRIAPDGVFNFTGGT